MPSLLLESGCAHSRCSAMNFMNEYTEGREEGKEGRREAETLLIDRSVWGGALTCGPPRGLHAVGA